MYVIAGYNGEPIEISSIQHLPDELLLESRELVERMPETMLSGFNEIVQTDKLDLDALDRIDKFFTKQNVIEVISLSDPSDFGNPYLVFACQIGASIGTLFRQIDGFEWLYSFPYFNSIIVHCETGYGITVFDWAVKKLSSYGLNDGLVAKFNKALEVVQEHPREGKRLQ